MKRILLIPNPEKDESLRFTKEIADFLEGKAQIFLNEAFSEYNVRAARYLPQDALYDGVDFIIALGGDGSFLAAARDIGDREIPIGGVNLGRLGFLAELDRNSAKEGLLKLLDGRYRIEKRMMLHADVIKENGDVQAYEALNDLVIGRGAFSRLVDISVFVDGQFADVYRADGLIISTPTGSTAYALAAGGPIVDPRLDAFLVTPICPHKLYARSIVVPPDKTIHLHLNAEPQKAIVSADGRDASFLGAGDILFIRKSALTTKLIKIEGSDFYSKLRRKLHEKDD